jgi:hypothetical protein
MAPQQIAHQSPEKESSKKLGGQAATLIGPRTISKCYHPHLDNLKKRIVGKE